MCFSKLKLMPLQLNKFLLLEDFNCKGVKVPKGYITNGADVPRIFWSIIPPFKPKFLPAVVVHDYLCDLKQYEFADYKFEQILLNIENSFITRAMVWAVRFYHKTKGEYKWKI